MPSTAAHSATWATRSVGARKKIEEVFGWLQTVAGMQKEKHRGTVLVDRIVTFAYAAYSLVRLRPLISA